MSRRIDILRHGGLNEFQLFDLTHMAHMHGLSEIAPPVCDSRKLQVKQFAIWNEYDTTATLETGKKIKTVLAVVTNLGIYATNSPSAIDTFRDISEFWESQRFLLPIPVLLWNERSKGGRCYARFSLDSSELDTFKAVPEDDIIHFVNEKFENKD